MSTVKLRARFCIFPLRVELRSGTRKTLGRNSVQVGAKTEPRPGRQEGLVCVDRMGRSDAAPNLPSSFYYKSPQLERGKFIMAQDKVLDPSAMLAAVEAKIAALQALSTSLRAAISIGALGPITDISAIAANGALETGPIDLPTNPFIGMSVPAAIKLYLSAARKKQTIKQIAVALKEGGMETTSSSFENIVTGALNRLKTAGQVLRFKDGWALAELYPEHIRSHITKDVKKKSPKRKGKGRKSKDKTQPDVAALPKEEGKQEKLIKLLSSKAGAEFSAQDLASSLGAKIQIVNLLLGKLVAKKKIEKTATGKYKAA